MKYTIFFIGLLLFGACSGGPKVIEAEATSPSGSASAQEPSAASSGVVHKVVADEILHTSKYTYLQVTEDGEPFWIAIPYREDVATGVTYYYRGGLKKVNFKSIEHDRVFETVYLVSGISEEPALAGLPANHPPITNGEVPAESGPIAAPEGGVELAQLIKNRANYADQIVRVRGRVVKVNNMIMNRNWIHIQDGSASGEPADLTVTTTETIPMGAVVTVEGRIALNKDFGAGYKYEIILEDAQVIP